MLTDLKRCERKFLAPTIQFISDLSSKVTTCDQVRCHPQCILFGTTLASLASRCIWIHTICQIQVLSFWVSVFVFELMGLAIAQLNDSTPPENINHEESNQDQRKKHLDKVECPKATNSNPKKYKHDEIHTISMSRDRTQWS